MKKRCFFFLARGGGGALGLNYYRREGGLIGKGVILRDKAARAYFWGKFPSHWNGGEKSGGFSQTFAIASSLFYVSLKEMDGKNYFSLNFLDPNRPLTGIFFRVW